MFTQFWKRLVFTVRLVPMFLKSYAFYSITFFFLIVSCSQQDTQSDAQITQMHHLNPTPENVVWGHYYSQTEPALTINSGDVVRIRTLLVGSPEMLEEAGVPQQDIEQELRDVHSIVSDRGPGPHLLTGPIYINGAEPGDVLEVNILSIETAIPYAYNKIGVGNGFLSNEFDNPVIKIVPLDAARKVAKFSKNIEVPLKPFFGSMGVAPPEDAGRISSSPPWIHAGNLDNKELVAGTTLFIPIHVEGALFQIGDGHAAQGNGEVDITALETSLKGAYPFMSERICTLLGHVLKPLPIILQWGPTKTLQMQLKLRCVK